MTQPDPYTMSARLCDDAGMVSDQRVEPGSPGTVLNPELTYRQLLSNLRRSPYDGPAFQCTGSAHLAGEHIRCTNPIHYKIVPVRLDATAALTTEAWSGLKARAAV